MWQILEKVQWESSGGGGASPPKELFFRRVAGLIANAPKVGTHMSGSAIDISVLHAVSRAEVDRGATYLTMSEL